MRWALTVTCWGLSLALILSGKTGAGEKPKKDGAVKKTFELQENGETSFTATFAKGKRVFVRVDSEKETDVDLFIEDADGNEVAFDDRVSKNCLLAFIPEKEQEFKIKVVNLGQGDNKGTVSWSMDMFKTTDLKPLEIKEDETRVFELHFTKGMPAAVFVESEKDTDVDLFIKDKDGNEIGADESGSKNCAVTWVPQYSGTYRILVTNLGEGSNRCKISHTGSEAKKNDDL